MGGRSGGGVTGPGPWPPLPESAPQGCAVIDVETTGFTDEDRVVQLAVTRIAPDGRVQGEWATLVDPGRHPGPVHIHGITPERLRGAPVFAEVAGQVVEQVRGRVLVAHNADFDYRMLHTELTRAAVADPVLWRLCTIRLARRAQVPVGSFALAALAEYFGVANPRAHDARYDVRATVQVLGHLLARAPGLGLPLTRCGGAVEWAGPHRLSSRSAGFEPVGRWQPGGPLVQGMRVLAVGPTRQTRRRLRERALAAGISWTSQLQAASLVVCEHPQAPTPRLDAVRAAGLPTLAENAFTDLLEQVHAGVPSPVPALPGSTDPAPGGELPPVAARAPQPEPEWVDPEVTHPLPVDVEVVRLVLSWPLPGPIPDLATPVLPVPELLVRARLEVAGDIRPGPPEVLTPEQPVGDDGTVRLTARTLGEASVRVALADLAPGYHRVTVTAQGPGDGRLSGAPVSVQVRGGGLRWHTSVRAAGPGPVPLACLVRLGGRWHLRLGAG